MRSRLEFGVHEVLSSRASPILIARLDKILAAATDDPASVGEACDKIEKVVMLFVGTDQAKLVALRLKTERGAGSGPDRGQDG